MQTTAIEAFQVIENPFVIRWQPSIENVVGWKILDATWDDAGFNPGGNVLFLESQDFSGSSGDSRIDNVQIPVIAAWTLQTELYNPKTIFQPQFRSEYPKSVSQFTGKFRGAQGNPTILEVHNFYVYLELTIQKY
jgi:hypothetical protein